MAPAKKSNKRKHVTETLSSSDEYNFDTESLPRKVKKGSSSTRSTARKSSDKNLQNGTSMKTESPAPGSSSTAGNQGASTSNGQESKHTKTRKAKDKSAKLSEESENAAESKSALANGKTSSASPCSSRKKRTQPKMVNGKKHEKKQAPDSSDDDSDSDQDDAGSRLEKVKNGLSAFRYQKSPKMPKMLAERKAAEPTPSTSKETPTAGKGKGSTCAKETVKVKVNKNSASSKASGKKSDSPTNPEPSSGGKKTGGKGKAKGQDKKGKGAKSQKEQKKVLYANLEEKDVLEFFEVTRRKSNNIVLSLNRTAMGLNSSRKVYTSCHEPYLRTLRSLGLYRTASPFDRRATALEWHPTHPTLVAAGSKGGDIILWNFEKVNSDCFIQGQGPGYSVSAMKFSPWNDSQVYTAQVDGTVSLYDFNSRDNKNFLATQTWSYWYCAVDVNAPHKMLVAGDSQGNVVMMDTQGDKLWQHRLHKSKVTHMEFNTGCDWLMVTASTDKTVKLWDIRMVEGRGSALYTLDHDFPINSAYFSPNDHSKLLTTDQHHDLRVYSGPDWGRLDTAIYHPHRFFQHLTPIKASWHPMCDLAVVGRYPDNKSPHHGPGEANTIDVFNTNTGETVCQLRDPGAPGIKSLNRFSPGGESLASGMGYNILIWQRKEVLQDKQEKLMEKMQTEVAAHLDTPGVARRQRPRPPAGKMAAKIKKKLQDL